LISNMATKTIPIERRITATWLPLYLQFTAGDIDDQCVCNHLVGDHLFEIVDRQNATCAVICALCSEDVFTRLYRIMHFVRVSVARIEYIDRYGYHTTCLGEVSIGNIQQLVASDLANRPEDPDLEYDEMEATPPTANSVSIQTDNAEQ